MVFVSNDSVEILKEFKKDIDWMSHIPVLKLECEGDNYYSSINPTIVNKINIALGDALLWKTKLDKLENIKKDFENVWNKNKRANWNTDYNSGFSNGYQMAYADLKELLIKYELIDKRKEVVGVLKQNE